jgi:Fe-Mn family superoxide dismutase
MSFNIPPLPFPQTALEPHMSAETVKYHYGKHTKKYFDTVNDLVKGTAFEQYQTLEALLTRTNLLKMDTALFNNACQAWNHAFFWESLSPEPGNPSDALAQAVDRDFGSLREFKMAFSDKAIKFFGSGWIWLTERDGKLHIKTTQNAENPLKDTQSVVLLVLDLWEHSWYLDHQNNKKAYVDNWWKIVNWDLVSERYESTMRKGS